jgi:hypothetical protein
MMTTATLTLEGLAGITDQAEGGPVTSVTLYRLLNRLEAWLRQRFDLWNGDRVLTDLMVGYVVKAQPVAEPESAEDSDGVLGYYYVGWGPLLASDRLFQIGVTDGFEDPETIADNPMTSSPEEMQAVLNWLQQTLSSEVEATLTTDQTLSPCLLVRVRNMLPNSHDSAMDSPEVVPMPEHHHETIINHLVPPAPVIMAAPRSPYRQLINSIFWHACPRCNSHIRNGYYTRLAPANSRACRRVAAT